MSRVTGVCTQNICLHVAAFVIPFNLICNMTMFWKFWNLTYWPHPRAGGGGLRANYCYHVAAFMILFNLICNMTVFWKFWPFDPTPRVGGGSVGKIFATMLCICDSISFHMQHDHVLKSWIFTFWPHPQGGGLWVRGVGSADKIFATLLLRFLFHLIWYATWPCSEKLNFYLLTPPPGWGVVSEGSGVCRQNICYPVAAFLFPFNLICNLTMFWKSWILTFWPTN